MSLVKWIRKNERKIMAVAVVVLMIGFIGGAAISQLARGPVGAKVAVGHFGRNQKVTNRDLMAAQRQLQILQRLGADRILASQELRGALLAQLLFSEGRTSPMFFAQIKRSIAMQGLRINDEMLENIFERPLTPDFYWILLKAETKQAGFELNNEAAAGVLVNVIPQLFNGASYSQLINSLIKSGVTEEQVLSAFSELLAVLEYSRIICSTENLTEAQIRKVVSLEAEKLDAELVVMPAKVFITEQSQPSAEQIKQHFAKYKSSFANQVSRANPYGFGYKLDDAVKLEYIAVKLDEFGAILARPTQQEKEEYYQNNLQQFTEQELSDPDDPNSPLIDRVMSFGEVAARIAGKLYRDRIDAKAETILSQAKQRAEKDIDPAETKDLSVEEIKKLAGDYIQIAKQLTAEHGVTVYAGRTGMLNIEDMQKDTHLGSLYIKSSAAEQLPEGLPIRAFGVKELNTEEDADFSAEPKLSMYDNIGPLSDISRNIAALVRIIEVRKATEPDSIDTTVDKRTVSLGSPGIDEQASYSVKEKLVEDLRHLAAMDTAVTKAKELIAVADQDGWDSAVAQFNELYPSDDANEPNTFNLTDLVGLGAVSYDQIEALKVRAKGNPGARLLIDQTAKQAQMIDSLFSLIPPDSNVPTHLPLILEMKPEKSVYCLKDISVRRIDRDQFDRNKAAMALQQEQLNVQNLAAVYFQPANIFDRMNFRFVDRDRPDETEPNTPPENEDAREGAS